MCTSAAVAVVAVAVAVAGAGAVAAAATATAAVASRNNIIHGKALKRYSHACFKTQDQIIMETHAGIVQIYTHCENLLSATNYVSLLFI